MIYSIYIYGPVLRLSTPPMGWVPRYHPPFPSICKLLAAFLRSSFVFARSLQHFWLPASHLLGTCYLFCDLRSTQTPSKYLRDAYVLPIVIYTCAMYLLPIYYLCTLTTLHVFSTYTVPTIHSNDAMHTIPIIPIIHTTHTIHMKHNYHTYHTYNSKHTCHTYHTIHTKHTILSKHATPDRPNTPYIPNIPYHNPTTTQGGRGTVPHPTTPPHHRGGRGKISIWDHMGPNPWGGRGGWQGLVHI